MALRSGKDGGMSEAIIVCPVCQSTLTFGNFCVGCNRYRSACDIVWSAAMHLRCRTNGELTAFGFLINVANELRSGRSPYDVQMKFLSSFDRSEAK
jgi:hypothetical protein